MNIYEKIIAVMDSIEYLKKDDVVGSGSSAYKAISDEKVKVAIRNAMIKNKLVMHRVAVETEVISREYEQYNAYSKSPTKMDMKIQHFTKVKSTYKIVNAENPEEFLMVESIGHGVDPQDKSAGKAMTYASKYALLDTFLIPTGEDTDKIHSNDIELPVNLRSAMSNTATKHTGEHPYFPEENKKKHSDTKTPEPKKLSADQLKMINTLITQTGTDRKKVQERFGVKSLSDLTTVQANQCINALMNTPNKEGK